MKFLNLKVSIISLILIGCSNVYSQSLNEEEVATTNPNWTLVEMYDFNPRYNLSTDWHTAYDYGVLDCNSGGWLYPTRSHSSELQTYWGDPEYVSLVSHYGYSCLALTVDEAMHEYNCVWYPYKSGMIQSKSLYEYGKFEIRCKLPIGKGFWPAFWLWSNNGEIDVFEFMNDPTPTAQREMKKPHFTYHSPSNIDNCGTTFMNDENYSDGFHVFAVEWTPNYVKWIVDGETRWMINNSISYFPSGPMHIIANLAIQHEDEYKPDADTEFPNSMYIDYIKVYQETDCKSYILCENDDATHYSGYNIDLAIPWDVDYNGVNEITVWNCGNSSHVCSKTVSSSLSVEAKNSIVLNRGFSALSGATFEAKISK